LFYKAAVYAQRLRLQFHLPDNVGRFGEVEALCLRCPVRYAVQPRRKLRLHGALEHGGMVAVADHIEVAVPPCVEARPEYGGIEELKLRKYVDCLVCYNRAGKEHPVTCFGSQPVHGL